MKSIFTSLCFIVIISGCKSGAGSSPKATVSAFIDAAREGDFNGIKKCITKSEAMWMDGGESLLARLDSNISREMKENITKEFKDKTNDARIEIKDEKIDGNNATVNVTFIYEGKNETRPFSLVKEDGQWKISLISTGLKNSGTNEKDVKEAMKNINMDSLKGAISEGLKESNKVDRDSLKKAIEEGMKALEKLKEQPN